MISPVEIQRSQKVRECISSAFHLCCRSFCVLWKPLLSAACAALILEVVQSLADNLTVEAVKIPALRVNGQAAKAHTQGLEIATGKYYVTARRDDVLPKRALLLRADATGTDWDVWDITPVDTRGALTALDHPGGFQSDGERLWIPLAESKRKGRSIVRVFPITGMIAGRPLKSEFEFPVDDHIGAVAVAVDQGLVFGANWDTETVYVWDLKGRLQKTLNGQDMESRGLGVVSASNGRAGLAVQDWKVVDGRLFASGLLPSRGAVGVPPQSQLLFFTDFLASSFQRWSIVLPRQHGTELGQEAMAISDGLIHFLPEDLGASNRIFRMSLADVVKSGALQEARSSNPP